MLRFFPLYQILIVLFTGLFLSSSLDAQDTKYIRSDIVFTWEESPEIHERFHTDMVSWGWLPRPMSNSNISLFQDEVKAVQTQGIRYQGRFELNAGWRNYIDYDPNDFAENIVTTLDGGQLTTPWKAGTSY